MCSTRFLVKASTAALVDPNFPVGSNASWVFTLMERSVIAPSNWASAIFTLSLFEGSAGVLSAPCNIPERFCSESAICSIHSAMDQESDALLKLSCVSLRPATAWYKWFWVLVISVMAISLSASVIPGLEIPKPKSTKATIGTSTFFIFIYLNLTFVFNPWGYIQTLRWHIQASNPDEGDPLPTTRHDRDHWPGLGNSLIHI